MVEINIEDNGSDRYTYEASTDVLGRMYDNNAESIVVNFPDAELGHGCTMIVVKGVDVIDHIDVEDGEPVLVTDTLSQFKSISIGFSFTGLDGYVKNSESKKFKFLDAECPDGFVPQDPQQTGNINTIVNRGFANVVLKDGTTDVYEFRNIFGVTISEIRIKGGLDDEKDPTVPSHVKNITQQNINDWDNKVSQDVFNEQLQEINGQFETVEDDIERVESIAKGANQTLTYGNYQTMITALNYIPQDTYKVGQNVYILVTGVPDLWIAYIEETSVPYTYTSDDDFVNELIKNGFVQVGHYKLGMLETQKVNLVDYVKFTDYAGVNKAGVVKLNGGYGVTEYVDGIIGLTMPTDAQIKEKNSFIAVSLKHLDKAVKVGVTTNTIELNTQEKAKAQEWLGVPMFSATQLEDGSYSISITASEEVATALDDINGEEI